MADAFTYLGDLVATMTVRPPRVFQASNNSGVMVTRNVVLGTITCTLCEFVIANGTMPEDGALARAATAVREHLQADHEYGDDAKIDCAPPDSDGIAHFWVHNPSSPFTRL
jgi:hypothetical protein